MSYFLVLDIGTTGLKVFLFDESLKVKSKKYHALTKKRPQKGWVEQNPYEYLQQSIELMRQMIQEEKIHGQEILGVGITNQRETTILWDQMTGQVIYDAIVWEDLRTREICENLQAHNGTIREKTGLTIDPYFSATKVQWMLEHVPNAISLLDDGRVLFGTIDSWMIWNLSQGSMHVTDMTNASRTLLFNIKEKQWDANLLALFDIPAKILPYVIPSVCQCGYLKKEILGHEIPIVAVCGDQQSSMYAAGNTKGTTKITYGTGTFISQILGDVFQVQDRFFTTLIPLNGEVGYMIESKIACCGKQAEKVLHNPQELHPLLENLAVEVASYISLLPEKPKEIIVDGGLTQSEYLLEYQENLLDIPLKKQDIYDGTALGCAQLVKKAIINQK